MKILYTGEGLNEEPKGFSVFLAGPTPRDKVTESWRPDMIETLKNGGFQGTVVAPEYKNWKTKRLSYDKQVDWELHWLKKSHTILFWVPRNMKFFPALTTNIEFGEHMHSGKVVLGYPTNAEHMEYFKTRAEMHDIPCSNDMKEVADMVLNKEKIFLYKCGRCYGFGRRESNGTYHICSKCEGTGFIEPSKKK